MCPTPQCKQTTKPAPARLESPRVAPASPSPPWRIEPRRSSRRSTS
jgi:hypothetical protein